MACFKLGSATIGLALPPNCLDSFVKDGGKAGKQSKGQGGCEREAPTRRTGRDGEIQRVGVCYPRFSKSGPPWDIISLTWELVRNAGTLAASLASRISLS